MTDGTGSTVTVLREGFHFCLRVIEPDYVGTEFYLT